MALLRDKVGAKSQDGINANVGIEFLNPNRTVLLLPLQQDSPMDPDEMVLNGAATHSMQNMFKELKPAVEVSLSTGDEANPMADATIEFTSIKSFEPDSIMDAIPLLRDIKDKQSMIQRLEQLLQEPAFQKIIKDPEKKQALVGFLRSVITDIEAVETEE